MTTTDDEEDEPPARPAVAHRIIVAREDEGERLDKYLAQLIPDTSRSQVQKHIDAGTVRIDGAAPRRGAATALVAGWIIDYLPPAPVPIDLLAEDIPITVLHEDADVVAVDKPVGLVVHPALGHWTGTLVNALLFHVRDFAHSSGDLRPGIVHRLDRDTSGVMIVAKHEVAHRALVEAFQERRVEKEYLAVTHGRPIPREATIDTFFGRHPTDRKRFSSKVTEGKRATTDYVVERTFGSTPGRDGDVQHMGAARVRVTLQTGRTHQIRVHFADRGHPLVGDTTYGTRRLSHPREARLRAITDVFPRPALHARRLVVPHPRTRVSLVIEAPVPADLVRLLSDLEALS